MSLSIIKTHGSVSCGPRNGTRAHNVSILTGTTKSRFSRIRSSMMPQPNCTKFAVELLSIQGMLSFKFERNPSSRLRDMSEQNFVKISSFFSSSSSFSSSSFRTLYKNRHNSQTRTPIKLKFATRIGGPKANICIKFGANPIKIEGVTSDFTRKKHRRSVTPTD